jgi:hypothetical protein
MTGEPARLHLEQRVRVDAARLAATRRERAVEERAERCDAEALRAHERGAAVAFGIAPPRPGTGVEQHADDREVDARARRLGRRGARERAIEHGLAIDPARLEVAPPAVIRDVEVRKALARDIRGDGGGRVKACSVEREVRRRAGRHAGRDVRAALSNGRERQQGCDGWRGERARACAGHRSRPRVRASCAASGGASSLK